MENGLEEKKNGSTRDSNTAKQEFVELFNITTRLCYVEGMKKALKRLTPGIGQLDIKAKSVLFAYLDELEKEIAEAEKAAQVHL